MLSLLVLCLVSLSFAQVPKPCITPPVWEAKIYSNNQQQKLSVGAKLSYDATYRRARVVEEIRLDKEESAYDILSLFELNVEFQLNLRTRNCTRHPIDRPWRDFGIQPDASFVSEAYIGSSSVPSAGLLITVWSGNHPRPQNQSAPYIATWTLEGCLPVSDSTNEPAGGVLYTSFYDITVGLSDPNVFIPARECLTDSEYKMRHILFRASMKHNK